MMKWVLILLIGAGAGWTGARWLTSLSATQGPAKQASSERKPLFYRNPMNPTVTSPVPAKDAMGMDYIPVYADDAGGADQAPGTVVINPTVVQSIGVRTTKAVRKTISRTIQTVGRVGYDEELLIRLHPKVSGWIEKLFVDETGAVVKPDTMLLSIYSPQLVASEEEYLLALKNLETLKASPFEDIRKGAEDLLRSSRERLELLDVPAHQIRTLEETRRIMKSLHIHSPAAGIVLKVGVREGQHVTPATELYDIADLSRVWVYVDVYEYELPWVRTGDEADMRLDAMPGRTFRGKITYIYPYLDAKTRTNKVRLEFDNREGLLKPDMFADVSIRASRRLDAVVIPSEAVIRTGRTPKVFVRIDKGTFEPRDVRLGVNTDGETQILAGVKPGEEVLTSAQFLIDSESSLKEAAAKMVAPRKRAAENAKKHEAMKGMKMPGMSGNTPPGNKGTKKGMDVKDMDMSGMEMSPPQGRNGPRKDMQGMSMPSSPKQEMKHE